MSAYKYDLCKTCGKLKGSPSGDEIDLCTCDPKSPNILDEAKRIVEGSRNDDYGSPERNHERIAKMWSAFLGLEVSPRDVCAMMILVKISRERNTPKRDNAVDIAGYAYLMDVVVGEEFGA